MIILHNVCYSKPSESRYLTFKLALITLVGFVFLLSSFFLNSCIHDRQNLLRKAKENVVLAWAGPQSILGSIIIVPYSDISKKNPD